MNDDVVSEARHNVSCPVGGRGPPCPHGTSCLFVSRKTLHVLSTWVGTVTCGEGDKKANVLNRGRADLNR
jgi:hypothetical protein